MPRKPSRRGRSKRNNNSNTRIHIAFKSVIEPTWTPDTGTGGGGFQSVPLNVAITDLTKELGTIYKLYRFVSVALEFQADPNPSTTLATGKPVYVAMNYIPAKETPITVWPDPLNLEKFEGPAIGFYAGNRGHPYHYKVPKSILLSMPYNWYETKQNSPQFSDYTQGQMFLKTTDLTYYMPILASFVVEFQTMEDPEFLTGLISKSNCGSAISEPKYIEEELSDKDECVSIYNECRGIAIPRAFSDTNVSVEAPKIKRAEKYCRLSRV
jgi:hypothetical protein